MQLGAVLLLAAPVAGVAIADATPVILSKVAVEAGLLRIGAQIAAKKYGAALIGATALNIAQNGGDVRKIDAFDITTSTLNPYTGITGSIGMAGINSLIDYSPFSMENQQLNYLGNGKNIFQVGFDFSFSLLGETGKFTYGALGGTNGTVGMFTDVVTGNLGGQVQQLAGDKK